MVSTILRKRSTDETMDASEKPGCLGTILRVLGLGATPLGPHALPYRVRDDFLSPAELNFYRVLKTAASEWATICLKVSLDDLFYAKSGDHRANVNYRNRIARKHVDFLLCDPQSMFPLLAIELDDSSHRRDSRQTRDRFVEGVFAATGLPLLRVPVQAAYNVRELSVTFWQAAGMDRLSVATDLGLGETPVTESTGLESPAGGNILAHEEAMGRPTDAADQPPACPRCGQPMVLRLVRKEGPHKGRRFWGCQDFPRCRGMREYAGKTDE